jgi:hypothetical protein
LNFVVRLAGAYALSFLAAGAVQQTIMRAVGIYEPLSALPLLAAVVGLLTTVFGGVLWICRTTAAARWTAGSLLAVMLVFGVAALGYGLASMSPGVGGNIVYGLAQVTDFYFLLPAAFGVPIHWLLLRGGLRP